MGTTPKKLTFLVTPEVAEWPEVRALAAQGHAVHTSPGVVGATELTWDAYDLILAPQAWRMNKNVRPFLDLAIKEARKLRYPPKPAKMGTGRRDESE